ncbi:hypothetical protein SAMN02745146_0080 [Hymenobacter daecheongensis DSM 21074]|uniref:Uncharacterized protein n=1 Tax=Hymenobacter daecheongensis DSM 21074 TaxID=1121955 RepID=A0A1M6LWJ9_9BACT|nr:hypothetical protein [Hymenobacter daecheongensis]SHJ75503.1 hypothetical protein SAMN02745146_0080 [Hymenobacter daecheongensis DSM 21074]
MKRVLAWALGLFVAFCVIVVVVARNQPEGPSPSDPTTPSTVVTETTSEVSNASETAAIVIAQNKIKERLKSPGTADFEMFNGEAKDKGNGKYIVRDHVDSQNELGATVRTEYIVELQYTGGDVMDDNSWQVTNLVMN